MKLLKLEMLEREKRDKVSCKEMADRSSRAVVPITSKPLQSLTSQLQQQHTQSTDDYAMFNSRKKCCTLEMNV